MNTILLTYQVSISSPNADKALRPISRGKADQGFNLFAVEKELGDNEMGGNKETLAIPVRSEHGDRSKSCCFRNYETSPTGSYVEQVADHC